MVIEADAHFIASAAPVRQQSAELGIYPGAGDYLGTQCW